MTLQSSIDRLGCNIPSPFIIKARNVSQLAHDYVLYKPVYLPVQFYLPYDQQLSKGRRIAPDHPQMVWSK